MRDTVDELTQELRSLKLRETELLERLTLAKADELQGKRGNNNKGATTAAASEAAATGITSFCIGDRVSITNSVKNYFGKGNGNRANQEGNVIKLTPKRVSVLTDSGHTLIRAPHNLRHSSS